MKVSFFHSLVNVFIIMFIIPGIAPVVLAAPDDMPSGDDGNSTVLLPDLIIDAFNYPETLSPGEMRTIGINVKNQGTAPSEKTKLVLYVNGSNAREWNIAKLSEGEGEYNLYAWVPRSEGLTEIKAVVDGDNSINERDETNNEKTATVIVAENFIPDLIIEGIVQQSEAELGKPLNLILKVKNQGTIASTEARADYFINGTAPVQNGIQIPALSPLTGIDVPFSLIPDREGQMEVKVLVDSGASVGEISEDNNEFTKIIDVNTLLPDLKIDSLSLDPQSPLTGDTITFTASIKNEGLSDSAGSELKYQIDGTNTTYNNTVSVPAIVVGGTATSAFSWVLEEEGNLNIKLVADSKSAVHEDDETNNEFVKTISIARKSTSAGGGGSGTSSGSGGGSSSSKSNSMGGGVSREPAKNIEVKELDTRNIMSGYHVKYDFAKNATCVTYVDFDSLKTFKKTVATVEVLKGKSIFVKSQPPGRVYKQLNIWIGNKGAGLEGSLENAYTGFKVDREWMQNNSVNESNIALLWYNNSKWSPLDTEKTGENNDYVYFRAETTAYSCFAISEYTGEEGTVSINEEGIQKTLRGWNGEMAIMNSSAERENGMEKKPMGAAKILLAVSLPLFMILVEYFVLKKKI